MAAQNIDFDIDIPPFKVTDLDSIPKKCARVTATFRTNRTKDLEWRKMQLRKLYWAMVDYTPKFSEALRRDLNKCPYEVLISEIDHVKNDCLFLLSQLDRLAADDFYGSPDVPLAFSAAGFRTRKEPLGAVLIIGPYNYPINLLLCPLAGAIAAGCTAVLKPSEVASATAMVLQELIEGRLDSNAFAVVNGGVAETTALLDFRDSRGFEPTNGEEHGWGKIFYTGNRQVARIIATKAAATLTPVTLELGGRNPAFVTANAADVGLAARRLFWGKTLNAGQVCLSPNYVLVQRSVLDAFLQGLHDAHAKTFPNGANNSELAHVINERHFLRLKAMVDNSKGRIVLGGNMDQKTLFMEPTVVLVDSVHDAMLQEESFGPIFSILPVDTIDEAICIANQIDPTPLALFSFGSKEENMKILREVNSGGATLNDSFMHGSLSTVEFGGVGHSGTGSYRGRASFDAFTHRRTVAEVPSWIERFLRVRYMPYIWRERLGLDLISLKPNFNRNGSVNKDFFYWIRLVLGLGGRCKRGALVYWCGCVVALVMMYVVGDRQRLLTLIQSRGPLNLFHIDPSLE